MILVLLAVLLVPEACEADDPWSAITNHISAVVAATRSKTP